MYDFERIRQALINCDAAGVAAGVKEALDQRVEARDILKQGLMAGMDIVGERMESEEMFIPEVLMAAQAMGSAVQTLKPLLAADEISAADRVVIGTVQGDLHDIGKNLVAMLLESAGFEVTNLGVDISPERFVAEVSERQPQLVCLSALLTTTMPMMKKTIDLLTAGGRREQVKVLIGGAPVTQEYADQIGADGYAPDAGGAIKLARSLVG